MDKFAGFGDVDTAVSFGNNADLEAEIARLRYYHVHRLHCYLCEGRELSFWGYIHIGPGINTRRKEIERLLQEILRLKAEILRLNDIIASLQEDKNVMNQSAARAREVCTMNCYRSVNDSAVLKLMYHYNM